MNFHYDFQSRRSTYYSLSWVYAMHYVVLGSLKCHIYVPVYKNGRCRIPYLSDLIDGKSIKSGVLLIKFFLFPKFWLSFFVLFCMFASGRHTKMLHSVVDNDCMCKECGLLYQYLLQWYCEHTSSQLTTTIAYLLHAILSNLVFCWSIRKSPPLCAIWSSHVTALLRKKWMHCRVPLKLL